MKKYRFRFTYHTPDNKIERTGMMDIDSVAPVAAVNAFHVAIQREPEIDAQKVITRPPLKANEYKMVSMHHVYHEASFHRDISSTPIIESGISLPRSPNPVMTRQPGMEYAVDFEKGQGELPL